MNASKYLLPIEIRKNVFTSKSYFFSSQSLIKEAFIVINMFASILVSLIPSASSVGNSRLSQYGTICKFN